MGNIIVTSTIRLPDGVVLTKEQIDSIQKIVDGGVVDPGLKDCKVPPTIKSVEVKNSKLVIVKWHGEDVFELRLDVRDGAYALLGSMDSKPKASDNATLTLTLDIPLIPGQKYSAIIEGVSCKGGHAFVFEAPKTKDEISIEKIEVSK